MTGEELATVPFTLAIERDNVVDSRMRSHSPQWKSNVEPGRCLRQFQRLI